MPITVQVAQHSARSFPQAPQPPTTSSSQSVLTALNHRTKDKIGAILETASGPQTSLPDARIQGMRLSVEDHGLVRAALSAYNNHYHLVLRPEDVWFAVLTQFSFFVNAHAEELRGLFVPHEGKKGLIVRDEDQTDMGQMCRNMTELIESNIVDSELRAWILPTFTTSTMHDEVAASVIMMGTLQKYFDYVFDATTCGIPTVTLLGEPSDWEDIQQRIEKLSKYGKEPTKFLALLRPVLRYMVATFTRPPGDAEVVDFWSRIIRHDMDSGQSSLSGWVVAFCFWDENGKPFYNDDGGRYEYLQAMAKQDAHRRLDDAVYHEVNFDEVPAGFVSVPVTYMNPSGELIDTMLLAGFVGLEATRAVNYPWKGGTDTGSTQPKKQVRRCKALLSWAGKTLAVCHGSTRSEHTIKDNRVPEAPDEGEKLDSMPYSRPSSLSKVPTPGRQALNTVRPVTGWWMYKVRGGKNTGIRRSEFYDRKMTSDWNGQASTAYTGDGGSILKIEERTPNRARVDAEDQPTSSFSKVY